MYSPGVHTLFHLHQIYCFLGEPPSRLLHLVNLTVCSFQVLLSLFKTDSHNLYKTLLSYLGKVLYHLKLCVLYLHCD